MHKLIAFSLFYTSFIFNWKNMIKDLFSYLWVFLWVYRHLSRHIPISKTQHMPCPPPCKSLNSFQHLINPSIDPSCPSCDSGEAHTTHHLFHCAAHPTGLGVRDLWDRPDLVSSFLASLPFFDYLPALPPPPPEPPPTGPAL